MRGKNMKKKPSDYILSLKMRQKQLFFNSLMKFNGNFFLSIEQ